LAGLRTAAMPVALVGEVCLAARAAFAPARVPRRRPMRRKLAGLEDPDRQITVPIAGGADRNDELASLPLLEQIAAGFVEHRVELGRSHELLIAGHPDAPAPSKRTRKCTASPAPLHLVESEIEEVGGCAEVAERLRQFVRSKIHAPSPHRRASRSVFRLAPFDPRVRLGNPTWSVDRAFIASPHVAASGHRLSVRGHTDTAAV
jgi:hypothetical protein